MKHQYIIYLMGFYCFLIVVPLSHAQTVNTGDLTISPETIFSTVSDFDNTSTGSFINDGDVYVYANWNNDGVVDFMGDTGLTRYIGDNIQTLSGSQFCYLYNALFDNASSQLAFNLSGAISIANESDFEMGIVDNDNYGGTFQFEIDADHNYTSDDSHVDGPVVKVGDDAFIYPIGDRGYYRFAGISSPDVESHIFTGKYFFEETNTSYPVTNMGSNLVLVDNAEHWTIEPILSYTKDVMVTLSWSDLTTPTEILAEPLDALRIARWDDALQLWVDEGGVVDVDNQTVTTAVDAYGVFTLARINEGEVLPCELTIYNLVTPNGDGYNDFFNIEQAVDDTTCANNMNVKIFNRWGTLVYEASSYDEITTSKFYGYSDGNVTISRNRKLPTGTYFYILTFDYELDNTNKRNFKKAGYLYINGND